MTAEPADPDPGRTRATPARGGLAGWQVRRLNALADGDLRPLTAAALAREVRLSPYHFTRAFSSSMGTTPGRWLTRARVERARDLLEDPGLSVTEVARQVGYKGAPQLTRAFRCQIGESPTRYRELKQVATEVRPRHEVRSMRRSPRTTRF